MNNAQLYLAIGVPMAFNAVIWLLFSSNINGRFSSIESRMAGLEEQIRLLVGAIHELGNRLSRLEERAR